MRAVRSNWIAKTAQLERASRLGFDASHGETLRGLAHEDLARCRSLLEARGHIHGLTRREGRVRLVDDHLAGLDADARLETELA